MFNRITHPEELLPTAAETRGQEWIDSQKDKYGGLGEVVRSFFSLRNMEYDSFGGIILKYGGLFVAGGSAYMARFLERADRPEIIGAFLLIWGLAGLGSAAISTRSSMDKRREDRERKRRQRYV